MVGKSWGWGGACQQNLHEVPTMCLSLCWVLGLGGKGSCNEFRVNRENNSHERQVRTPTGGTELLDIGLAGSLGKVQGSVD